MRLLFLASILSACSILVACGDEKTTNQPLIEVAGTVTDSDNSNFNVCFDCNKNMICDENEASSQTNQEGQYHLSSTVDNVVLCPKIAVYINTQLHSSLPYTLISPPEYHHISPLTTLTYYQNQFDKNMKTAANKIQQAFLTDIHPNEPSLTLGIETDELYLNEQQHIQQVSETYKGLILMNLDILETHQSEISMTYADMHEYLNYQFIQSADELMKDLNTFNSSTESENPAQQAPATSDLFFNRFFPFLEQTASIAIVNPVERDMEEEMKILALKQNAKRIKIRKIYRESTSDYLGVYTYQDTYTNDTFDISYVKEVGDPNTKYLGKNTRGSAETLKWNLGQFEKDETRSGLYSHQGARALEFNLKNLGENYNYGDVIDYSPQSGERILLNNADATSVEVLVTANGYDLTDRKISSYINMQDDLSLWKQVIDTEATFASKQHTPMALDITTQVSFDNFLTLDTDYCQNNQNPNDGCNGINMLEPEASGGGLYGYPSYYLNEKNNASDLGQLLPPNNERRFIRMPILFKSDENEYLVANFKPTQFNGSRKDVYFYKLKNLVRTTKSFKIINKNLFAFRPIDFGTNNFIISDSAYSDAEVTFLGSGNWTTLSHFRRRMLVFSVPTAVQRMRPELGKKLAIFEHQNALRMGAFFETGDPISSGQNSVTYSAHHQIIDAVKQGDIFELYLQHNQQN